MQLQHIIFGNLMMLNKHIFSVLVVGLSLSGFASANTPIESRSLSQNSNAKNSVTTPALTPNINWQMMQNAQQLEADVRNLRGKIEEQEYEIGRLKNELNNRYTDLDQRLELLRQKVDGDTETTEESTIEPQEENQDITPSTSTAISNVPLNANSNLSVQGPSALEKEDYTKALDAYKTGGAKQAIQPMKQFIQTHPNSAYMGNAHFWLAEFNLALDPANYAEAKKNFSTVLDRYPHSAKASSAAYRLYSIALNVDHNAASAQNYKNKLLSLYPQSQEAGYIK